MDAPTMESAAFGMTVETDVRFAFLDTTMVVASSRVCMRCGPQRLS